MWLWLLFFLSADRAPPPIELADRVSRAYQVANLEFEAKVVSSHDTTNCQIHHTENTVVSRCYEGTAVVYDYRSVRFSDHLWFHEHNYRTGEKIERSNLPPTEISGDLWPNCDFGAYYRSWAETDAYWVKFFQETIFEGNLSVNSNSGWVVETDKHRLVIDKEYRVVEWTNLIGPKKQRTFVYRNTHDNNTRSATLVSGNQQP